MFDFTIFGFIVLAFLLSTFISSRLKAPLDGAQIEASSVRMG
jgi:hypothetical protein